MANSKAGQVLSQEEVREYAAYHNAGVTLPEKFDGVVIESTLPSGPVYRWQTNEEAKAGEAAADAALKSVERDAALTEKVRAEAARRGVEAAPAPPAPPEPAPRS